MVVLGLPIAAARRGGRDGDDHGFRLRTWPELTEFGRVDGGPWRIVALVTPWTVIWWRRGPIHKSPVGGALFLPYPVFSLSLARDEMPRTASYLLATTCEFLRRLSGPP
jgi:hypothetical protein